jgi:small ligand-binding sensory domain FIST
VLERLEGRPCHLACVFTSSIYRAEWPEWLGRVHEQLRPRVLIGCSGSGIIGAEQELEWVPALSIVAADLPTVQLYPFTVTPEEAERERGAEFWIEKIGVSPEAHPVFVLCADPYTCDPTRLLAELNDTYPGRPIIGGLVSGGNEPGEHLLFMDTEVLRDGAVGVAMAGNIALDTVVSPGCRPFGRPYVVTKADEQIIWQLGGRPAIDVLHEALSSLSKEDHERAQEGGVMVGLVINEMRQRFASDDFIIRQIVGIDPSAGAVAISGHVRMGQTLQFHLRDAGASRDELRRLLTQQGRQRSLPSPAGALIFNCLGRGKSFYGTSHHDVKTIQTLKGKLPIGGFFCNGEIGPVGGINFLHGYTASLGFFRPAVESAESGAQVEA